jgi:RNA polymerase sigma-70 factor (ECF subfamily)
MDSSIFEQHRDRLFGIAYRMLGSIADAEDVVQDAFVRWAGVPEEDVRTPAAYLTSIVTRRCIDHLRTARVQREQYIGPWLPEPLVTPPGDAPEAHAELSDSLSMAFLLVLEHLSPVERAVFLLHEVFDYNYAEIAPMVGKSEANCRQINRRARTHLDARPGRFTPSRTEHEHLLEQFLLGVRTGDLDGLLGLLSDDVVVYSDGGGKAAAARKPIEGAPKVANFFVTMARKAPDGAEMHAATVNGQPGFILSIHGQLDSVMTVDVDGGVIRNIYMVRNPDKLQRIG